MEDRLQSQFYPNSSLISGELDELEESLKDLLFDQVYLQLFYQLYRYLRENPPDIRCLK